jgi:hypothetical protein
MSSSKKHTVHSKDDKKRSVRIQEFRIEDVPMSATFIVIAPPKTGKTSFIENMAYYLKHRYPVCRIWLGTGMESLNNRRLFEVFPPLFISSSYNELEHSKQIQRQKQCLMENSPNPYCFTVMDDCADDTKILKNSYINGTFKNGSQHWGQIYFFGSQYSLDLSPGSRKSASYIVLGAENDDTERRKIYDHYGGLAGSYSNFCDLLDQITGDHTFLIIKKVDISKKFEENFFFYQTKQLKPWRFGCDELWAWNSARLNKNFVETFK